MLGRRGCETVEASIGYLISRFDRGLSLQSSTTAGRAVVVVAVGAQAGATVSSAECSAAFDTRFRCRGRRRRHDIETLVNTRNVLPVHVKESLHRVVDL